jgi:hypothetical protein
MQPKANKQFILKQIASATFLSAVIMMSGIQTHAQISTATIVVSAPTATAPSNVSYCTGATTAAITLAGSTGATFDVTGGAAIGLANQTDVTSIPAFQTINAGATTSVTTITVTPKNGSCTGTPVTFTISVVPSPNVTATTSILACNGIAVPAITFTGTVAPTGTVYNWTVTGDAVGISAASGTASIATFNADNTTTADKVANVAVAASYTDAGKTCTSATDNFTTAYAKPDATITPITPICSGTAAQVTYNALAGASPFSVVITDGTTPATYNGVVNADAISVGNPSATTTYSLTNITDAHGCVNP